MKKNNKGFTLVELLAAIVILGILSVLALPMITGMVEKSRNKMYITDARKLISLAEYQMKSSSSTIDKPDPGDFIIISMHYLDNSSFSSAPNGGEYEIDHSFVVIKNNGGTLEYSACIVESLKKGGYKGVVLTKESDLLKSNAHVNYVHPFTNNELVNVEADIDSRYVNQYLGSGYVTGDAINIYHYHDIEDSNIQIVQDSSPVIDSIEISGGGNLNAKLVLKASDKDTSRNNLQVFVSIDTDFTELDPKSYGTEVTFNYNIDFSKYGYSYASGGNATIYVIVKDPNDNSDRKSINYTIKKNEPPSITASLKKRENDSVNELTAVLKVTGDDDLDDLTKLSFCIKESGKDGVTDCANYKTYAQFFSNTTNDGGTLNYTFKECPGGCKRDGATQYLALFVKDSMNAVTSKVLSYTFSRNVKPKLDGITISSVSEVLSEGSKDVRIELAVSDDHDSLSQLKATITDGVTTKEYSFNGTESTFPFTVDGDYIGSQAQRTKNISVYVVDSEGARSDIVTKPYTLYENKAPQINSFVISSNGNACNIGSLCTPEIEEIPAGDSSTEVISLTKDGSLNTILSFSILDDIEVENNYGSIKVCVSQVKSDCNNDANFKPYSEYTSLDKILFGLSGSYKGTTAERTKTVYLKIKDRYGLTDEVQRNYILYEDKAPQIKENGFILESRAASFVTEAAGDISAYLKIVAEDDFDSDSLVFTLKHNGVEVITNQEISSLYTLQDSGEVDANNNPIFNMLFNYLYSVSEQYDGSTHQFEVYVTDKSGYRSSSKTYTYKVYKNLAPHVGTASVSSAYNEDGLALLDVYFNTGITDDIDSVMNMQYCYKIGSGTAHCMDTIKSSGMAHLTTTNLFSDFTGGYNGQKLTLYAVATDSGGLSSTSNNVTYTLHKATAPVVNGVTAIYDSSTYDPDADVHPIDVTFDVSDSSLGEYSICLSNTSTCTNYFGSFVDNGDPYTIPYNYPAKITSTSKLYIYAKNSAGTSTSKNATISSSNSVNNCKFVREEATYQYTAKTAKVISTDNCAKKCYHNNTLIGDTNSYNASYTKRKTINYYDKLSPDTTCRSSSTSTTTETKYCDFKDCFYDGGNNTYKQQVLGTFLFDDSWTIFVNGTTYDLDNYYKVYESDYHDGDEDITLTEINTHVCPFCYQNGYYGEQYQIRVADFDVAG